MIATLSVDLLTTISGEVVTDVNAAGESDHLGSETIALDGAQIVLRAAAGHYAAETEYTIMTATEEGGLTGSRACRTSRRTMRFSMRS